MRSRENEFQSEGASHENMQSSAFYGETKKFMQFSYSRRSCPDKIFLAFKIWKRRKG